MTQGEVLPGCFYFLCNFDLAWPYLAFYRLIHPCAAVKLLFVLKVSRCLPCPCLLTLVCFTGGNGEGRNNRRDRGDRPERGRGGGGPRGGAPPRGRGRGGANAKGEPLKFENDFDFESANAQFDKEEIEKELKKKLTISGKCSPFRGSIPYLVSAAFLGVAFHAQW